MIKVKIVLDKARVTNYRSTNYSVGELISIYSGSDYLYKITQIKDDGFIIRRVMWFDKLGPFLSGFFEAYEWLLC